MPSRKDLLQSNNEGALGIMIEREFNGKLGHVYPRQDSDFIVGFTSEETTPSIQDLRMKITNFYIELGYEIEKVKDSSPDTYTLELYVFCTGDTKVDCSIYVLITTLYPLVAGGEKNHIRVTTNING